jgi:Fucose 4-O-acetylase and related acetyltransferases
VTELTKRDHYFDNAKCILILLVVAGHFIEPAMEDHQLASLVFKFIYLFHMPAFIFISGYFSKTTMNMEQFWKLMKKFLLLYIIVQLTFIWFTKWLGLTSYQYTLTKPAYIYWYLFAMAIWCIALLLVTKINLKLEYVIATSFIIGLLAGYIHLISWELSLSRIIVFFPYFLMGYYYKSRKQSVKDTIKRKEIAILIFSITFLFVLFYGKNINHNWLFCAEPYKSFHWNGITGLGYRGILYGIQLLMVVSFFRLIPDKKNRFTVIGTRTLWIYILHGFFVKLLVACHFYDTIATFTLFN